MRMNLNPKQIFLHACFFPQFLRTGSAVINVPLRGFSYPQSHKQIRGSDSMKLFHFYSNALGTNFSAEMRFLGGPDRNMGSGLRIKVALSDSWQKYSSAFYAFFQSLMKSMIMYEKQTQNGVEWKLLISLDCVRPHLPRGESFYVKV